MTPPVLSEGVELLLLGSRFSGDMFSSLLFFSLNDSSWSELSSCSEVRAFSSFGDLEAGAGEASSFSDKRSSDSESWSEYEN